MILLSVRNQQIDLVQPGKYVLLEGAKVEMFKGTMRLAVDRQVQGAVLCGRQHPSCKAKTLGPCRTGAVKEAPEGTKFEPSKEVNMSKIEFDVIPVPGQEAGAAAPAAEEVGLLVLGSFPWGTPPSRTGALLLRDTEGPWCSCAGENRGRVGLCECLGAESKHRATSLKTCLEQLGVEEVYRM